MKRHLTCAIVVVAALGMLGACSDDDNETQFPTGKMIPASATSSEEGYIEYKSDETYVGIDGGGDVFTEGTYTIDGDEITFETDSFCEAIAPDSTPETYTFEWDDEVLTFVDNPDDTCADRAETLVGDWKLATD
ncbi:MAG: hypothetical protein ACM3MM_10865 [Acidobacteriota bacterium]|jgi:hypothetical protein